MQHSLGSLTYLNAMLLIDQDAKLTFRSPSQCTTLSYRSMQQKWLMIDTAEFCRCQINLQSENACQTQFLAFCWTVILASRMLSGEISSRGRLVLQSLAIDCNEQNKTSEGPSRQLQTTFEQITRQYRWFENISGTTPPALDFKVLNAKVPVISITAEDGSPVPSNMPSKLGQPVGQNRPETPLSRDDDEGVPPAELGSLNGDAFWIAVLSKFSSEIY